MSKLGGGMADHGPEHQALYMYRAQALLPNRACFSRSLEPGHVNRRRLKICTYHCVLERRQWNLHPVEMSTAEQKFAPLQVGVGEARARRASLRA